MKKTIIFDFDGVIADTADIMLSLMRESEPEFTEEDFKAHHDGNVYEEPLFKLPAEAMQQFYDDYCSRLSVSHIQTAIAPIKRLSTDYRLFIVSSNEEYGIHSVLKDADLTDCFEAAYGYNTHKSKIVKFEMIRDTFDVDLEKVLFITDTLGDIKEANKLGIKTIAETFGFHNRARLEQGDPHTIVDTWDEIEAEIHTLSQ